MIATYTKLKNGEWGIRVTDGTPRVEQRIVVTKKDGTTKTEMVTKVLWSGNGVSLCAIAKSAVPANTRNRRRTGCACGSIEGEVQDTDCWSCRHDQE